MGKLHTDIEPAFQGYTETANWWKEVDIESKELRIGNTYSTHVVERNLVYDVSEFQKFLWKEFKEVESRAPKAELLGKKKHEAFNVFAEELFHRFYSYKEKLLEEPASCSSWAQALHEELGSLPEFKRLKERCRGKDWWAGNATTTIMEKILAEDVLDNDTQIPDIEQQKQAKQMLDDLLKKAKTKGEKSKLQKEIDKTKNKIKKIEQLDQKASQKINKNKMRTSARKAMTEAEADLDNLDKAQELMDSLAGTEAGSGQGSTRPSPKILKLLKENNKFRHLVDLIGKMERLANHHQKEKARKGTNEIAGISIGDDIPRLLPVELVNLTDPTLEALFMAKLHERSLLEYYLKEQPVKNKGPIVVLLDVSYSMAGSSRAEWATAATFGIAAIAAKQKRSFAVVCFAGNIEREFIFSKKEKRDPEKVMELLEIPYNGGGTNFEHPLNRGLEIIQQEKEFKEADIIMITDGESHLDSTFLDLFAKEKKELEFKVMSMLVGNQTSASTNEQFSDLVIHVSEVVGQGGEEIKRIFEEL